VLHREMNWHDDEVQLGMWKLAAGVVVGVGLKAFHGVVKASRRYGKLTDDVARLEDKHDSMDEKVGGIERHVSQIDGKLDVLLERRHTASDDRLQRVYPIWRDEDRK
jgi:hypothetical protein